MRIAFAVLLLASSCWAANNAVTVTIAGGNQTLRWCMAEFSGIQTSPDPLDKTAQNIFTSTSAATSGTSAATSQASELAVGAFIAAGDADPFTATNSYTLVSDSTEARRTAMEYLVLSSTGTQQATMTYGTANAGIGEVATFKSPSTAAFVTGNGQCQNNTSGVASGQLTFTNAATAGNLIVVVARIGNTTSTATIADTEGNTYTAVVDNVNNGGGTQSMYMWYAYNIAGDGGAATTSLRVTLLGVGP